MATRRRSRLNKDGKMNEDKLKTKYQRATRLMWILVAGAVSVWQLATGTGLSQMDRFASKVALATLGVIIWHIGRSQMFYYFDMKAWTDTVWATGSTSDKALVLLAYCILFGLLAVAVVLAPALGL